MTTEGFKFLRKFLPYLLALVLCLTLLIVFVPLNPVMPTSGIDASWMFAMNQSIAQKLSFGKDMIFTFGPYASIYTQLYHPATDRLMVWGSVFLALNYFFLLLLLGKGVRLYALVAYGVFLATLMPSRDALLFSYLLILSLVIYRVTLPDDQAMKLSLAKSVERAVPLFFAPLGLLPLIKGSLLPICGITAILCGALYLLRKQKAQASLSMGIPAISCVLFWVLAGQPIPALPGFFLNSTQIISGYTEAMALPGDWRECVLYALASVLILLVVVWTARGPEISRGFLCVSYALFLFTAFKSGFIRHDLQHNMIAGTSILAAALLLMFVLGEKHLFLPLVMAAIVWMYMNHTTPLNVIGVASNRMQSTFERAGLGVRKRWSGNEAMSREYDKSLAAIRDEFPIPSMSGTSDFYSFNQAWLLASKNKWEPHPVAQTYSAYTPALAELDLQHLQGSKAPDNIVFRVEPIDGRLPSLEDGLSWPALINGYFTQKLDRETAFLRKRTATRGTVTAAEEEISSNKYEFGEEVSLPEEPVPLFARLEITPTFPGRVLSALYKPPTLYISLRLRDDSRIRYRTISNMMRTDFLISPLIENTQQFVLLAASGTKYLANHEVQSITISSDSPKGLFWNAGYSLRLSKLFLSENTDAENSLLFDKMENALPDGVSSSSTLVCEGMIETVNGKPARSGIAPVTNILWVNGWMTVAAKDGTVPDSVFVTLTNETGKTIYVPARNTPRNDVKRHFQQPAMPDPGYTALIDVSALTGHYTLGLARSYKGNLGACQQFKLPFAIVQQSTRGR